MDCAATSLLYICLFCSVTMQTGFIGPMDTRHESLSKGIYGMVLVSICSVKTRQDLKATLVTERRCIASPI